MLAKIRTVDGSNSGLDADLLDGLTSAQFLRADGNGNTSGSLTVGGGLSVNAGNRNPATINQNGLTVWPLDDNANGGGFSLQGAGNFQHWTIQNHQGNLRLMEPQDSVGDGRDHGNLQIMRAGNGDPVNVSVDGNISAHRVQTQGVVINNRLVLNENGTLNQAQWNRHAQLRILTNTIGRPDLNMYVNYPNRANSKTYLYNDPKVEGTLTVAEDIILGGSRIFDSGMTFTCESGGDPLGSCPNSGTWNFNRIILTNDQADANERLAGTPNGSLNVSGDVLVDDDVVAGDEVSSGSHMRVGQNIYLGGNYIYDSGVTYTCEAGGRELGACPNEWLVDL